MAGVRIDRRYTLPSMGASAHPAASAGCADDVVRRRLHAQRLTGSPARSPVEAVRLLGAVQAQDYAAAKWALGLRTGVTDREMDQLFDAGAILRTHMMRPTWHFVLSEDIGWIQELTSPRVLSGLRGRHRQLELDGPTVARAIDLMGRAVRDGNHLTREQLALVLSQGGIAPDGQRMPHLLSAAEHAGVITSGPRQGKRFTYALLDERAPVRLRPDRDEALGELARRYFTSHGPAQVADYVWWSSLTTADARCGIEVAGTALQREVIDGKEHWSDAEAVLPAEGVPQAHLLPNFDEYTVAYRDRSAIIDPTVPYDPSTFAYYREASPQGSILSNIVVVAGRLRGAWSARVLAATVRVQIRPMAPLGRRDAIAVKAAAMAFAAFHGREMELQIV